MPMPTQSAGYEAFLINLAPGGFYGDISRLLLSLLPIDKIIDKEIILTTEQGIRRINFDKNEFPEDIADLVAMAFFQALILRTPTNQFALIEFTDGPSGTEYVLRKKCPNFKGSMLAQYDMLLPLLCAGEQDAVGQALYDTNKHLVTPGYFSRNVWMPMPEYQGTIDKLFFAGTLHQRVPERQVLHILRHHPDFVFLESLMDVSTGKHSRPMDYHDMLNVYAGHRGVMALRGTSRFCYREFDALAGGYPLFMHPLTYTSSMEPLINNEHYFAIDFDVNPEVFAQRIMDRFYAVRGDAALLDRVRRNGQAWFQRNAEWPIVANRMKDWVEKTLPL